MVILVREWVLPWYKGEGKEMEIHHFPGVHRVTQTYTGNPAVSVDCYQMGYLCLI